MTLLGLDADRKTYVVPGLGFQRFVEGGAEALGNAVGDEPAGHGEDEGVLACFMLEPGGPPEPGGVLLGAEHLLDALRDARSDRFHRSCRGHRQGPRVRNRHGP
ncbi:hypothetical protein OT109_10320 [Phycisphaeraceae bacterium D3-23]